MNKVQIVVLIIVTSVILSYGIWYFIFNIFETTYRVSSERIYADNNSTFRIVAIPLNSLGFRPFFRNSQTEFTILEGSALITIVKNDSVVGEFIIKAKMMGGRVKIRAKSKYSLLPTEFEIILLANLTMNCKGFAGEGNN